MSELIIRNLQSVQRIEASNKAYYAAEAGLEDALYELTPHFPGYQTSSVRSAKFGGNSAWKNEWQIESRSGRKEWSNKMFKDQKLMIFLFNDTNGDSVTIDKPNAINDGNFKPFSPDDIEDLNVSGDFSITFKIPDGVIPNGGLRIDNDNDYGKTGLGNGLNEDGPKNFNPSPSLQCPGPEDADCDGLVDEDSEFDPFIMWKLTDGAGRSLIPIKGCINPITPGSNICEDNFLPLDYSITLDQDIEGINQDGDEETIGEFITHTIYGYSGSPPPQPNPSMPNSQLHFEFLIVAPMEHTQDPISFKKFSIPYIEYTVKSNADDGDEIPLPYFTIKSDGYYQTFKQSITAMITPKTTVPLFDFTIIQQQ
jgi:hypothetical protein